MIATATPEVYCHQHLQCFITVMQSSELEASNKVLSRDVALVDSDMVRLKEKLAASRIQTLHTQALSNQLSQELTVLQRVS